MLTKLIIKLSKCSFLALSLSHSFVNDMHFNKTNPIQLIIVFKQKSRLTGWLLILMKKERFQNKIL